MAITYHENCSLINWHDLATVIERAPLGKRDAGLVGRAFRGSTVCCFALDGDTLIGAGRAISDGASNSAIFDVVILPEYQRKGVGRAIVERLLERLPPLSVLLLSVPAQQEFYKKLGFHRLKTAYLRHADIERWIRDGYIEQEGTEEDSPGNSV